MSRILVTGSTGGLGLAVVNTLVEEGHQVRATGRQSAMTGRLRALGADVALADLNDESAVSALVSGMDCVVHCAALSSPWGSYADFHAINVVATRRLLIAARKAGVNRFVFISSPSVYARRADQLNLTEADTIASQPLNAYAATKALAEQEVLEASDREMTSCLLRPRAIVGPDDQVLLPRILRIMEKGVFPMLRGGKAVIELTDVRDVAQAVRLALAADTRTQAEIFNISGGRAMTVRAMIEALSEAIGKKVRLVPLSYPVADALARAAEKICAHLPGHPEPPVTAYSLAVLAFSQTFNMTKARQRLGYNPRYDAFETALQVARSRAHDR